MTVWFVSRHPGAFDWLQRQGIAYDQHADHLDVNAIEPGDTVIGALPVQLAARVCALGANYLHLSLQLAKQDRGRELTADDLVRCGARLLPFFIQTGHKPS